MIISLDIETRSACDLLTTGGYRYAEDPSTEILCYAYKIDDGPAVAVAPEYAGLPDDLYAGIKDGATIRGWNIAGFDVPVWNRTYTLAPIRPEQVDDTLDRARAFGLPGRLDRAAQFMGLKLRKDLEGHKLMMKLCKASNPYPTEEELERLAEYCRRDVDVEAKLAELIPPLPDFEVYVRKLTHDINRRGIKVDLELARRAVQYAEAEQRELADRLTNITQGEVTRHTQRDKIFKWLAANGCELPNLQKQTLEDALNEDHTPVPAREVIEIRLSGAKASTAKFKAALDMAGAGDRIRGTFVYFGAPATGRWSGRGIQPHNLPRETADDPYAVLEAIRKGEVPSVYKALSTLLRPLIVAEDGHKLVRCDFSAIEGRVVAWLADDKEALEEYAGEGRLYEQAAAGIYGCEMDAVTKAQRQIGKVSELACNFGGGWRAFESMAKNYGVKVPEDEAREIVNKWRGARPAVVRLWDEVETAVLEAYRETGEPSLCCDGKVEFIYDVKRLTLWIKLPSSRFICLPGFRAHTEDSPYGPSSQLTYRRGNWTPKEGMDIWPRAKTYGGSLVESLAQGIARDLLAWAMMELEDWGIVMHVHDEIVCEVEADVAEECLQSMVDVMSLTPDWAEGLPLAAVGEISDRFGK